MQKCTEHFVKGATLIVIIAFHAQITASVLCSSKSDYFETFKGSQMTELDIQIKNQI